MGRALAERILSPKARSYTVLEKLKEKSNDQ